VTTSAANVTDGVRGPQRHAVATRKSTWERILDGHVYCSRQGGTVAVYAPLDEIADLVREAGVN
jgi:hypothetical protein